ncbi:unnamed protein product [Colias eurytheme]|nr:unnamed protein product [Colias eurytheme]
MHRLRLMSFEDNPKESKEASETGNLEKLSNCNANVEPKKSLPNLTSESQNVQEKTLHKSLSELFRLAPYGIHPSPKILKRQRIHDLKNTVLSNTFLSSKKIKEKLLNVRKSKDMLMRRNKKRNVNENTVKKDDVKVLFTSTNWTARRKRSSSAQPGGVRKYNIYYDSNLSSNFHRITPLNRINRHICCRLQMPRRLRYHKHSSTKNTSHSSHRKHCRHYYSDLTIKPKKNFPSECRVAPSVHYNVVDFSGGSDKRPSKAMKNDLCVQLMTKCKRNVPRSRCITRYSNKEVSVTPSCLPCSRGGGDTAADISTQVATCKIHHKAPKKTCQIRTCSAPQGKIHQCTKARKQEALTEPIFLANTALKYILFFISIIVWSPCILITFFIWIFTYPMRPQEVLRTEDHKTCPKRRHNFLYSVYTYSAAFVRKLTCFYGIIFSSLKKDQDNRKCERKSKVRPNPNKKYTLFYNNNRGWVIKPIKSKEGLQRKDFENKETEHNNITCADDNDVFNGNKKSQRQETNTIVGYNTETIPKCKKSQSQFLKAPKPFIKREHARWCSEKQIAKKFVNANIQTFQINEDESKYPKPHFEICQELPEKHVPPQIFTKSKNIPVYASLQKSHKYVTFDDNMQRIFQYDPYCEIPQPCSLDPCFHLPRNQYTPRRIIPAKKHSPCRCIKVIRKVKQKPQFRNDYIQYCTGDTGQQKSVKKEVYKENEPKDNKKKAKNKKIFKKKVNAANYCRRFKNKISYIVNDVENSIVYAVN